MVVTTRTRISETNDGMHIKTILSRIQKHQGFVYGTVQLEPMKKVARMLHGHRPLLLNWFRARGEISAAVVEGLQQQSEIDHQKGVRLSLVPVLGNRSVPYVGVSYRSPKRPTDSAEDQNSLTTLLN